MSLSYCVTRRRLHTTNALVRAPCIHARQSFSLEEVFHYIDNRSISLINTLCFMRSFVSYSIRSISSFHRHRDHPEDRYENLDVSTFTMKVLRPSGLPSNNASFRILIELVDGKTFTNNILLREDYLLLFLWPIKMSCFSSLTCNNLGFKLLPRALFNKLHSSNCQFRIDLRQKENTWTCFQPSARPRVKKICLN